MLPNSRKTHSSVYTIITLLMVMLIAGCAQHTRHVSYEHIKLERVDSSTAAITSAYLTQSEGRLALKGELKRKMSKRGVTPGHLHVAVIDSSGEVIDDAVVCYKLKCKSTGTSSFSYKTSRDPGKIKVIRMSHHNDHSHTN